MKIKTFFLSIILASLFSNLYCASKKVAFTIDDLPFVGEARNFHLNMLMETLLSEQVPATGFIIASEVHKENWETLRKFRDAGFGLGNHTFSHANLNVLKTKKYLTDIKKADTILTPVMTQPKFFRYPYLAMGYGDKRSTVLCYLAQKDYQIAPITIDSKDFAFNQRLLAVPEADRRNYLEELKPFYLDFIRQQIVTAEEHDQYNHRQEQAQILLIHANLLNAYVLPDIIHLFKEQGYEFISLQDALSTFKQLAHCAKPMFNNKPQPIIVKNESNEAEGNKSTIPVKMPKKLAQNKTNATIEAFIDWD